MRITTLLFLAFAVSSCGDNEKTENAKPQWILQSKKFFTYSYTPTGKIDTTYVLHMNYENAQKKDSMAFFTKSLYDGNYIREKMTFKQNDENSPELMGTVKFVYDQVGRVLKSTMYNKNILYKEEAYIYDTSGKLVKYTGIFPKEVSHAAETEEDYMTGFEQVQSYTYDTTNLAYEYDASNRVVRSIATDNRGNLIRTDINIYSGSLPLAAYSLDKKGDTVQKMTFQPEGNLLKTITTTDSLVVTKLIGGIQTPYAQVTEDKKRNKLFRRVYNYSNRGLSETSFYYLK